MPVTVLGNHETKRRGRGLSSRGQILREVREMYADDCSSLRHVPAQGTQREPERRKEGTIYLA